MEQIGVIDQHLTTAAYTALSAMNADLARASAYTAAAAKETAVLAVAAAHERAAPGILAANMHRLANVALMEYTTQAPAIAALFSPPTMVNAEQAAYTATVVSIDNRNIDKARRIMAAWPALHARDASLIASDIAVQNEYLTRAADERDAIRSDVTSLGGHRAADLPIVATWATTGISRVALASYIAGAALANTVDPACDIQWYDVAAVGFIESRQGRYSNAAISQTGEVEPPILGVALDGTHNTAKIPMATVGIADGGGPYARAVGPLQMLPTTFVTAARLVQSRTGIVLTDPNNFPQAAQAAAVDLCANASFAAGPQPADYLGYNDSLRYAERAVALAEAYSQFSVPQASSALWPAATI